MKRISGILIFIVGIVFFSCQSEKVDSPADQGLSEKAAVITLNEAALENATTELEYEVDFYANAEFTLHQWLRMGRVWQWTNKLRYKMDQCPDIHIESEEGGYPKTITLDYGDSTVLRNGRVFSGVIMIEISGPRKSVNYTRMVTYQDFGVDSLLINGSSLVTFDREEDVFRTVKSDMTLVLADGTVIDSSSERTWEWIEGMDTEMDQTDDVIQIAGFVVAEASGGDTYRKDIVEPLIRQRDCRFIVKGIVEITLNGELVSSLDYGDGECNNIAILTKDGETYEVDLSQRKMHKK